MTVQVPAEHRLVPPALTFTAGAACGLAASASLSFSTFLLYTAAGLLLPAVIISAAWTKASANWPKALFLFLLAGMFCAFSCRISSSCPPDGTGRGISRFGAMIMDMPFRDRNTAALVTALVSGDRTWLPGSIEEAFRRSGASHILALSGLHLGMIYLLLGRLLGILGNSPAAKAVRSTILVVSSGIYTVMTGASPSLVRAFLFILLNETAHLLHRRCATWHILCAALMLQTAANPAALTSTGFELSYLAMTGISLLYPRMKAWYPADEDKGRAASWCRIPEKIWDTAALTISCQIFTGPLAWLRFGTLPKYFLITNLLSMPLTSILMMLAVPSVALHAAGLCPAFLTDATEHAASALIFVMDVISEM